MQQNIDPGQNESITGRLASLLISSFGITEAAETCSNIAPGWEAPMPSRTNLYGDDVYAFVRTVDVSEHPLFWPLNILFLFILSPPMYWIASRIQQYFSTERHTFPRSITRRRNFFDDQTPYRFINPQGEIQVHHRLTCGEMRFQNPFTRYVRNFDQGLGFYGFSDHLRAIMRLKISVFESYGDMERYWRIAKWDDTSLRFLYYHFGLRFYVWGSSVLRLVSSRDIQQRVNHERIHSGLRRRRRFPIQARFAEDGVLYPVLKIAMLACFLIPSVEASIIPDPFQLPVDLPITPTSGRGAFNGQVLAGVVQNLLAIFIGYATARIIGHTTVLRACVAGFVASSLVLGALNVAQAASLRATTDPIVTVRHTGAPSLSPTAPLIHVDELWWIGFAFGSLITLLFSFAFSRVVAFFTGATFIRYEHYLCHAEEIRCVSNGLALLGAPGRLAGFGLRLRWRWHLFHCIHCRQREYFRDRTLHPTLLELVRALRRRKKPFKDPFADLPYWAAAQYRARIRGTDHMTWLQTQLREMGCALDRKSPKYSAAAATSFSAFAGMSEEQFITVEQAVVLFAKFWRIRDRVDWIFFANDMHRYLYPADSLTSSLAHLVEELWTEIYPTIDHFEAASPLGNLANTTLARVWWKAGLVAMLAPLIDRMRSADDDSLSFFERVLKKYNAFYPLTSAATQEEWVRDLFNCAKEIFVDFPRAVWDGDFSRLGRNDKTAALIAAINVHINMEGQTINKADEYIVMDQELWKSEAKELETQANALLIKLDARERAPVRAALSRLEEAIATNAINNAQARSRPRPFMLHMYGAPRIGKTAAADGIARSCQMANGESIPADSRWKYQWVGGAKFHDGLHPSARYYQCDDPTISLEVKDQSVMDFIIQCGSNTEYRPPLAVAERKDKVYARPHIMIVTSNPVNIADKRMDPPAAYYGRTDFMLHASLAEGFSKANGTGLDPEKVKPGSNHLEFRIGRWATDANMSKMDTNPAVHQVWFTGETCDFNTMTRDKDQARVFTLSEATVLLAEQYCLHMESQAITVKAMNHGDFRQCSQCRIAWASHGGSPCPRGGAPIDYKPKKIGANSFSAAAPDAYEIATTTLWAGVAVYTILLARQIVNYATATAHRIALAAERAAESTERAAQASERVAMATEDASTDMNAFARATGTASEKFVGFLEATARMVSVAHAKYAAFIEFAAHHVETTAGVVQTFASDTFTFFTNPVVLLYTVFRWGLFVRAPELAFFLLAFVDRPYAAAAYYGVLVADVLLAHFSAFCGFIFPVLGNGVYMLWRMLLWVYANPWAAIKESVGLLRQLYEAGVDKWGIASVVFSRSWASAKEKARKLGMDAWNQRFNIAALVGLIGFMAFLVVCGRAYFSEDPEITRARQLDTPDMEAELERIATAKKKVEAAGGVFSRSIWQPPEKWPVTTTTGSILSTPTTNIRDASDALFTWFLFTFQSGEKRDTLAWAVGGTMYITYAHARFNKVKTDPVVKIEMVRDPNGGAIQPGKPIGITERDMCVFEVGDVMAFAYRVAGSRKKYRYFPPEFSAPGSGVVCDVRFPEGSSRVPPPLNVHSTASVIAAATHEYAEIPIPYFAPVLAKHGHCGSQLRGENGEVRGMLVGVDARGSIFTQITEKMLSQMEKQIYGVEGNPVYASDPFEFYRGQGATLEVLAAHSMLRKIPPEREINGVVMGSLHPFHGSRNTSSMIQSPVADAVREVFQFDPNQFTQPHGRPCDLPDGSRHTPWSRALEDMETQDDSRIHWDEYDGAVSDLIDHLRAHIPQPAFPENEEVCLGEATMRQALNGDFGVMGAINHKTSAGMMAGGRKEEYLVRNGALGQPPDWTLGPEAQELWDLVDVSLDRGEIVPMLANMFLKLNEVISVEKVNAARTRTIQTVNFVLNVAAKKVFGPLHYYLQRYPEHTGVWIGVNMGSPDAIRLVETLCFEGELSEEEKAFDDGDTRHLDLSSTKTKTCRIQTALIRLGLEWGLSPQWARRANTLLQMLTEPWTILRGDVMMSFQNCSGIMFTTEVNSWNMVVSQIYCCRRLFPGVSWREIIRLATYGDDLIRAVRARFREKFSFVAWKELMAEVGYECTNAAKTADSEAEFRDLVGITFLKRQLIVDTMRGKRVVRVPLAEKSILKMLCWIEDPRPERTLLEHTVALFFNAQLEYFMYGEVEYQRKQAMLHDVATRAGVANRVEWFGFEQIADTYFHGTYATKSL